MSKNNNQLISWEAEEHIQYDKNIGWYIGLFVVAGLFVALSIFLKWWTFTALIVVSVIALIVYVVRPPEKIKYTLSTKGLTEGNKLYSFEEFRSFGLLKDSSHFALVLIPRKRFNPAVTVYFPENKGEEIVDMFGKTLPMEEVKLDAIDKIVKLLRI